MKIALTAGAVALIVAMSAVVDPVSNMYQADKSVSRARQERVDAFRSGDGVRIANTEANLTRAYDVDEVYHQRNGDYARIPKSGEARDASIALLRVQDAAQDAELSENPQEIARTKAELKAAYARNWAATHRGAHH